MPINADPILLNALELDGVGLRVCRHGPMLYFLKDRPMATALEAYGEWSEGEIQLLSRWISAGDVVVEVGANIGTHTVPFAKLVGPTGHVIAFEPQRMIYFILCGNLALNALANVDAHWAAAGERAGAIDVPKSDYFGTVDNYAAIPLQICQSEGFLAPGQADRVPLQTIDSLALSRVRLIKADVEGMELDVLRGARKTIECARPVLYLEADRPENYSAISDFLKTVGYDAWWHIVNAFTPHNFGGAVEDQTQFLISLNIVCLPKGSVYEMPASLVASGTLSFLEHVNRFGNVVPNLDQLPRLEHGQ